MTNAVLISAICNRCNVSYPEFWTHRNLKGEITLEGAICQTCGSKNCLTRDYSGGIAVNNTPPAEDGNINRFEYSFRDDSGKIHKGKMDPKAVQRHAAKNS